MSLEEYRKKRDFRRSNEPYGSLKANKKLIYLIQKHAASHLHYDLRLQLGETLKSWAIPKGPSLDPAVKRLAVHVEDHPIEYAKFEGIIPAGQYGGGTVMLWDTGTWQCKDPDAKLAYKKGHLSLVLQGKKLKGQWNLIQLKNSPKNWLLIKVADKYAKLAKNYDLLKAKPNSVISHRSLEAIAKHNQDKFSKKVNKLKKPQDYLLQAKKKRMPTRLSPELATLVNKPPVGEQWLHEIKFDGYRLLGFIKDKKIKLMTRNGKDWTKKFPAVVKQLRQLKVTTAILDGELIAVNQKKQADFQLLANTIHNKSDTGIIYVVFDLIYYNGMDLSLCALQERKNKLSEIIPSNNTRLIMSDHIIGNKGDVVFNKACQQGLEGIVSKKIASPYIQKRSRDWLKVKCTQRQEFLVVGFTPASGKRHSFASLLLAFYAKNHQLVYCGKVGTGFNEASLKNLSKLFAKHKAEKSPVKFIPTRLGKVTWLKPNIIVEVEFREWTKAGLLRHPSFKGLRTDKKPSEIIRETKNDNTYK